ALLALMAVMVFAAAVAVAGNAKFAVRSCSSLLPAATAMPLVAAPGEPRMYGMLPALPAAETTTTPAFDASSAALASALSAGPKSEPSDMLMTSMSLSMAHSMASVTTLVEPAQPNTRTAYRSAFGATPGPIRNWLLACVRLS